MNMSQDKTTEQILNRISCDTKTGKETCLKFKDGNDEHIWARITENGIFLDSENVFDSSAAPSETEPLLQEAGIEIEYEPMEWFHGFHATATVEQFKSLLTSHTATICGNRIMTQEEP